MEEWADKLMELNDPVLSGTMGVASKGKALRRQNKPAEALNCSPRCRFHYASATSGQGDSERAHSRRAVRQFSEAPTIISDPLNCWRRPGVKISRSATRLNASRSRTTDQSLLVARIDNVGSKFWRYAHMCRPASQKQGKLAEAKAQYEAAIKDNDYWWKNSSEQQISAIDSSCRNNKTRSRRNTRFRIRGIDEFCRVFRRLGSPPTSRRCGAPNRPRSAFWAKRFNV